MALSIQRETVAAVWGEIQSLLDEHWREIAHFEDIPLDPRKEMYDELEARGALRVFTVRDEGTLVGYSVNVVANDIHYARSKQSKQDVLFLLPAYRNQRTGINLINFVDSDLQRDAVQCSYQHVKMSHDFGPLLAMLGYEPVETIWVKRLDHGL